MMFIDSLDDDVAQLWVTGSKYLEYNPGSELNIFTMNNEHWKSNQTKISELNHEQKSNKGK
jgi:hypothetical protein